MFKAVKFLPNKIGIIAGVQSPQGNRLKIVVISVKIAGPTSKLFNRSNTCSGRSPSGPPAEPIKKLLTTALT